MAASAQQQAAMEVGADQARLAQNLQDIVAPQLQQGLAAVLGRLRGGPGTNPDIDRAYDQAMSQFNTSMDQGQRALGQTTAYRSNAWGAPNQTAALGALTEGTAALDQQRQLGLRRLEFQKSTDKLEAYNKLMDYLTGGANTAIGLAQGSGQLAAGALGGLRRDNPWVSAGGGALSGAATGYSVGGPYGAAAGAVLGGVLGYGGG